MSRIKDVIFMVLLGVCFVIGSWRYLLGVSVAAILIVLVQIRTELTDLVATDNQSQDKPLKSATPTPLSKQEEQV